MIDSCPWRGCKSLLGDAELSQTEYEGARVALPSVATSSSPLPPSRQEGILEESRVDDVGICALGQIFAGYGTSQLIDPTVASALHTTPLKKWL